MASASSRIGCEEPNLGGALPPPCIAHELVHEVSKIEVGLLLGVARDVDSRLILVCKHIAGSLVCRSNRTSLMHCCCRCTCSLMWVYMHVRNNLRSSALRISPW